MMRDCFAGEETALALRATRMISILTGGGGGVGGRGGGGRGLGLQAKIAGMRTGAKLMAIN